MAKPQPDLDCLKMAVEVTKSAIQTGPGWITKPDEVAKFIETVALKLTDLRFLQRQ